MTDGQARATVAGATTPATRPAAPAPAPLRPGSGAAPALTWLAALTVFAVVLIVLAWRMLGGEDPALGAGEPQQAAAAPVKRVIVRRIIRRRIVVTTEAPGGDGTAAAVGGAVSGGASPVRVSAPPAPASAPAAVTRSS